MTLLNVLLSSERALVAMDTRMQNTVTGGHYYGSKMFPIVHANILIACRGELLFGALAFQWYWGRETCDFDSVVLDLPDALVEISKRFASIPGQYAGGNELIIVGWSEKERSMQGVACTRPDMDSPFSIARMETGQLAPAPTEDLRHITCADQIEYLTVIARAQTRQSKKDSPDSPIGGRLILADMTRDRMEIRPIADLEAPPQGPGAAASTVRPLSR